MTLPFDFDIAIIGAGLAGSTAALQFARSGARVAVVDPYATYPADFRCEKLTDDQLALVNQLGLTDVLQPHTTVIDEVLVGRGGRLVEQLGKSEQSLRYDTFVNAVRAAWPQSIAFHTGRVQSITPDPRSPSIRLASGVAIGARLAVLATGPGEKLRADLGMKRRMIRDNHSICIGFDLVTRGGVKIADRALTYYGERAGDNIAYATLFPLAGVTRCNFFCYLDPKSAYIRSFRQQPLEGLLAVLPGLANILGPVVARGKADVRITDLYAVDDCARDGVVLVGDAQHSSCPVTGTGVSRVLTDVVRLCHIYWPRWQALDAIDQSAIASFYADPVKQQTDRFAALKAERDRRQATVKSLPVLARRAMALARSKLRSSVLRQGELSLWSEGAILAPNPVSTASEVRAVSYA